MCLRGRHAEPAYLAVLSGCAAWTHPCVVRDFQNALELAVEDNDDARPRDGLVQRNARQEILADVKEARQGPRKPIFHPSRNGPHFRFLNCGADAGEREGFLGRRELPLNHRERAVRQRVVSAGRAPATRDACITVARKPELAVDTAQDGVDIVRQQVESGLTCSLVRLGNR